MAVVDTDIEGLDELLTRSKKRDVTLRNREMPIHESVQAIHGVLKTGLEPLPENAAAIAGGRRDDFARRNGRRMRVELVGIAEVDFDVRRGEDAGRKSAVHTGYGNVICIRVLFDLSAI